MPEDHNSTWLIEDNKKEDAKPLENMVIT